MDKDSGHVETDSGDVNKDSGHVNNSSGDVNKADPWFGTGVDISVPGSAVSELEQEGDVGQPVGISPRAEEEPNATEDLVHAPDQRSTTITVRSRTAAERDRA